MEAARKVVVVADHTKLSATVLARIAPLSRVDTLIVDDKAPEETLRAVELAGVHAVIAPQK